MNAAEVSQPTLREKIQIMETIWEDFRARADSFGISHDQKNLLNSRRDRIRTGEATILDWDSVKHTIGQA
ncbi:addiction module protein [Luteolibacter yonseiensis]|uniref:Addiction module protein n=1 Tax=Luteolibacter yonseiensis TaxID=1144680 RepID=A0A934R7M4_9BACT|nr:addiction module protein [Luteolibacter yonseiensis]MBK1816945.1 addiction module protein [Luteolibacter yonseiensis]